VSGPARAIGRSSLVRSVCEPLSGEPVWLVGGSLRDLLLDRRVEDVDLALAGDVERAARTVARSLDAHVFPLSEEFGTWRVSAPDRSWQVDLSALRGDSIEADLALRDFTVNAMAAPIDAPDALIDPHDGARDLERRILRVVSAEAYRDDPLRTLRMARFACELDLEVESDTLALASNQAGAIEQVAPERVFYELRRLIVSDDPLRGIELMDVAGLVALVLPELDALKGVGQNPYHHLDVWGHTLEVLRKLLEVEADLPQAFGELAPAVAAELERPLADELTRGQALRFGALFHDIGKPGTRTVSDEGRVTFMGHDQLGARISSEIARRLRASTALGDYLAALARHHLRLGFLVHTRPLARRNVYDYLRACEPVEVEVSVLSVADRLATAGAKTRAEAVEAHLGLAQELLSAALDWRREGPPESPLSGDELMRELGIDAGPRVGDLLELLREGVYTGEIRDRDQALELARARLTS
jgi:putative nucleotidyltransferase with HDIG domain